MTSTSPWRIEAVTVDPITDEIVDWLVSNPGPTMRGWLGSKFPPGVRSRPMPELRVTYIKTGHGRRAQIIKDDRRYRARYRGELMTLEAATKMMKEDLTHGRE
jgi:hypothetical protein